MSRAERRVRDRALARDTLVVASIILLVLATLLALWFMRELVFWLVMAVYLAWSLDPMASWLARKLGGRRNLGIGATMFAVVGVFVAVAWVFIPPIVDGAKRLQEEIPAYIDELKASDASQELGTDAALDSVEGAVDRIPELLSRAGDVIGNIGGVLVGGAFAVFMIVSLTIYFLIYGRGIFNAAERGMAPSSAQRIRRVGAQIYESNKSYWYGKFILAIMAGAAAYVVMLGLDIPFRAPLAFFVGMTSLVPNVGATIGTVGVAVVAAFEGWEPLLISVAALIAYQQIENVILTPRVFKKTLDLHPITSLAGVTAGGLLFGLVGALVAIPVIAAIKIIWREYGGGGAAPSADPVGAEAAGAESTEAGAALPDPPPQPG